MNASFCDSNLHSIHVSRLYVYTHKICTVNANVNNYCNYAPSKPSFHNRASFIF